MVLGVGGIGTGTGLSALQDNINRLIELTTQLSTGNKITAASDPAGLVISERLNAEVAALNQGIENIQKTNSVLNLADAGLSQTSNALIKAQGLAVAAQDSTLSSAEKDALQFELDSILGSIDFTANTTNFGGLQVLNGNLAPNVSNVSDGIANVQVNQVNNPSALPATTNVEVTATATQGALAGTITDATANSEFVISGPDGSASFNFAAGTSAADIETAINAQSSVTGVTVDGGVIQTSDVGSNNTVNIAFSQGAGAFGISNGSAAGTDIQGTINGQAATGSGNTLSTVGGTASVDVTFDSTAGTGSFNFDVDTAGFTTNSGQGSPVGLGIQGAQTFNLGSSSGLGNLSSLFSGGANSLESNPAAASQIIGAALSEVNSQQAQIGAFQTGLSSTANSLSDAALQLTDARSQIADTDFAVSIAEKAKEDIRNQALTALLAQTNNLNQQNILSILQTI